MATTFTLLALFAALVSWGVAVLAWRWRSVPGGIPFVGMLVAVGWWALCYAFEVALTSYEGVVLAAQLAYLGIVSAPVAWFIFSLFYTGRVGALSKEQLAALFIIPAITLTLVFTNGMHGFIWSDIQLNTEGPLVDIVVVRSFWFFIHMAYSYILMLLGSITVLSFSIRSQSLYRSQAIILSLAALSPLVGNLAYIAGWLPIEALDPTSLIFAASGWLMAWGVYRYRLLDVAPVARRALVDSMTDAMVALDRQRRIVDLNPAAERLVALPAADVVGRRISEVLPDQEEVIAQFRGVQDAHEELSLRLNEGHRYYDLRISPLYDRRGQLGGRLLVLRDITERKQLESRLESQMHRFEQLLAVARATTEQPTLEATLKNTLDIAVSLTTAERGSIFLIDKEGKVTHSILARGRLPAVATRMLVGKVMESGLSGWVLRHQEVALIEDAIDDPRWLTLPDQPYEVGSVLGVPIEQGERVIGVLTLQHSAFHHFSEHDADVMTAAVQQMALAIRNARIYEEQRRMADQQVTLYEVLRALQHLQKPEQVLQLAVKVIAQLTDWPLVAFLRLQDDGECNMVEAAAGRLVEYLTDDCPMVKEFLQRVQTFKTTQYLDGLDNEVLGDPIEGIRSLLFFPIVLDHEIRWVLCIGDSVMDAFDMDARLLAESLIEVILLVVRNAELYAALQSELLERERAEERLRVSLRKTDALYQVSRALVATYELPVVLRASVNGAVKALSADRVTLVRMDIEGEQVLDFVESGPGADKVVHVAFDELMAGLTGWVVRNKEPALSPQGESDPRESEAVRQRRAETESGAILVVPLQYMNRIYGTMTALNRPGQPDFDQQDADLLVTLAAQAAVAIHNVSLFEEIVEQQNRLQALVQSSRDGVILISMDLRVLVVNQPALDLLQLPGEPARWIDTPLAEALRLLREPSPHVVRVFVQETRRVKRGDEPPGQGEYQVGNRFLEWMNLPVAGEREPLGRLIILHDVTESRLVNKMREDLTHTMVHDLRNPLTGISGSLSLLAESAGIQAPYDELLDIARSSTQRMLNLVTAILDISRLESGRMPINPTVFSVEEMVNDVLVLQQPLAERRGIDLIDAVDEEAPLVWADADLMARVLQNLVGNALKFTSEGGTVRVTAWVEDDEPGVLRIAVSDTGEGIPPELQDRLFQKFVTGNTEGKGSGLGLAFCKMVVEAHSERIWVKSKVGEGTTFTFTLPLASYAMG